jgi:NAD(P)H-hydrate repair Nnr-like enzyme with NAD(P)H-hydrate dehydratase domain
MGGAALLAASAALHGGAGRVLVALLAARSISMRQPELMFRHVDALQLEQLTVVCGCGGGEAVRAVLPQVLAQAPRLVLDADALNAIASDAALAQALADRAPKAHATVLTPIRWKQRACWAPIPPACSRTASLRPSSWPSGSSAWWCSRARAR